MSRRLVPVVIALALLSLVQAVPAGAQGFTCTRIEGFSQTRGWFKIGDFERYVDGGVWELQWQSGASIDMWAEASFSGYSAPVVSPCSSGPVDRVLLTVSLDSFQSDTSVWQGFIASAVQVLRQEYPTARQIILQPVIGGPRHAICAVGSETVRASYNHPYVDSAIAGVVAADRTGQLVAGASPEVSSCSQYRDSIGHLTSPGYGYVGSWLGTYYAGW